MIIAGRPLPKPNNFTKFVILSNSSVIADIATNKAITNDNNVAIQSTYKYLSSGSLSFNGTNQRLISVSSDDFNFGTGDFTIEFFCYSGSYNVRSHIVNISNNTDAPNFGISSWDDSLGLIIWINRASDATRLLPLPSINTWHHIAYVRQSGVINIFIDGISTNFNKTYNGNYDIINPFVSIGATGYSAWYFAGYIDGLCILKGLCKYSSNFTPPTNKYKLIAG